MIVPSLIVIAALILLSILLMIAIGWTHAVFNHKALHFLIDVKRKKLNPIPNPPPSSWEVVFCMNNYTTFAETETLLQTAIGFPGRSIKEIAASTGIKPNTLYKWKTSSVHLSPTKADALLLYFIQNEPKRLQAAETYLRGNT